MAVQVLQPVHAPWGRRPIRHRVADICRPHYASRRHRASRQGVATGRADLLGHEDRVARMATVGRSRSASEATQSEYTSMESSAPSCYVLLLGLVLVYS